MFWYFFQNCCWYFSKLGLKRITRVLLAALLNHGRGESIVAIHRQVFQQRAALLNEINIYQNEIERKNNNNNTRNRENTDTNNATADSDWDGLSQSTSVSAGWGTFNDPETDLAAAEEDQQPNNAQVRF